MSLSLYRGALPLLLIASFPSALWAHGAEQHDEQPDLLVNASVSLMGYSFGSADVNGHWRIPGLLMGGDALPIEQGANITDAALEASYRLNPATTLHLGVGTHWSESHQDGLHLENLYLDYEVPVDAALRVSAGLLEAAFLPVAQHHAGLGVFAEAGLLEDALFGRSLHDRGLRLSWQDGQGLSAGVEAWQGNLFPASRGEGAQDVYLHYRRETAGWLLQSGVWAMRAKAVQRGDERYVGGHTHSGSAGTEPVDVRFGGDSQLTGGWFDLKSPDIAGVRVGLAYNAGRARSKGNLADDRSHQAAYTSDHRAEALSPYLEYGSVRLASRHERLALDNRLTGTAAPLLAEEANLLNTHQPYRHSVQLQWQANRQWLVQASYTRDHSLPGTASAADERIGLGVVWKDTVYRR